MFAVGAGNGVGSALYGAGDPIAAVMKAFMYWKDQSAMTTQRFNTGTPCPVCGGGDNLKRGQGRRCHGFLSSDGEYAHCSREEYAGSLPLEANSDTYAHRLVGDCRCGTRHDPAPAPTPTAQASTKSPIVATYDYHAADGTLAYQVIRRDPKGFSQRRPDGQGGWIYNLEGVERVLYGLPALLAADPATPVYVVEGEKDADALTRLGCLATTNPGGAKKWQPAYGEVLRGRSVVILPDNDEAGEEHAGMVARALLGVGASVRVVALPNLPEKGDVSDWLRQGGTVADLADTVAATPLLDARFAPTGGSRHRANGGVGFALTILADLLAEPVEEAEWVVEGLLPTAGTSLITAKPKVGKTTLVRNLALAVSLGAPFLGRATKQGTVLYLALEEKRGKVQEHFANLGATVTDRAPLFVHVGSAPAKPVEELEALLAEHCPMLVIIDPLQRFLRLRDGNDYTEVTRVMEPLTALARKSGAHLVCIHHANKGGYGGGRQRARLDRFLRGGGHADYPAP